jgi:hypothetical protein
MENDGEAIMHDMINTGREDDEGDYTQDNSICGAEQKGFDYWKKVGKFFHEQSKVCDRSDLSLSKRWGTIHAECSKFQGSFEKIQKRHISSLSAVNMVKPIPSLSMFFAYT